ncbi:hypothetical protein D5071_04835 [Pectobacterium carotovorum]|uniref:Uncharacterized protein n=1 Tax=Pectobacterium carotovorum TaxID=554 RepID=A0A419B090_PECCA|nr:hypothetical protein D5071_04835 [Pectobacterium carotovorum]
MALFYLLCGGFASNCVVLGYFSGD